MWKEVREERWSSPASAPNDAHCPINILNIFMLERRSFYAINVGKPDVLGKPTPRTLGCIELCTEMVALSGDFLKISILFVTLCG